jgi:hypothetical protein
MRALLALLVTAMLAQPAFAGDWRYCLAPSHSQHKIYMSPPFPATVSMANAESQFGRLLSQSGLRFDDVQCPRGEDETAAMTMQQHAISINRRLGNEIVHLRWEPRG